MLQEHDERSVVRASPHGPPHRAHSSMLLSRRCRPENAVMPRGPTAGRGRREGGFERREPGGYERRPQETKSGAAPPALPGPMSEHHCVQGVIRGAGWLARLCNDFPGRV